MTVQRFYAAAKFQNWTVNWTKDTFWSQQYLEVSSTNFCSDAICIGNHMISMQFGMNEQELVNFP